MNRHRFAGSRKQYRGDVSEERSKLVIDPLDLAAGARDQLADTEPYGISNEEAARQLDGFLERSRGWDLSHR